MKAQRGMVFGVFDGLHEGHKHFLREARTKCERLIVVVTHDGVSLKRKGFPPKHALEERIARIKDFDATLTVIPGDTEDDSWHILDEHDPERIFLGYDQGAIGEALKKMGLPHTYLDAYRPEDFKSSLRRDDIET